MGRVPRQGHPDPQGRSAPQHLPTWLLIVASGVWSLVLTVAPAAVAAIMK